MTTAEEEEAVEVVPEPGGLDPEEEEEEAAADCQDMTDAAPLPLLASRRGGTTGATWPLSSPYGICPGGEGEGGTA